MKIKFKKISEYAKLPWKYNKTDTGFDVFSVEDILIPKGGSSIVETGIQVAHIDNGYWFLIMPRSGLGFMYGIQPHLGTIDQEYRGGLGVKLYNFSDKDYKVNKGDRIAQLVVYPLINAEIEWTEEIEETNRGANGFGSSGV